MFYVLFTYSKGRKERDFRKFRSEDDLINFLHANYESIDIVQILGIERIYRLGLVETDEVAKSVLVSQELKVELSGREDPLPPIEEKDQEKILFARESGSLELTEPEEQEMSIGQRAGKDISEKDIEKSKEILAKKKDAGEKSGMEKIADDIEKEMTDEQIIEKNKEALKRADSAIEAAKTEIKKTGQKFNKSEWKDCPICHKEKVAPWSKKGICSICQRNKKKLRKKEEEI